MSSLLHRSSFKASKCKKHLQCTLERIRILRNKRTILVKQARDDVAKLLRNGQTTTAQARVEHAYKEQNVLEAYNILEQCCENIISGMPVIDSKKGCPPNLKQSIASLIYAAPRCGDLPELQSIREFVTLKLGADFVTAAIELRAECGVNNQIIQSLSTRAPNGQTKLKLLKEIAQEYKINWDHVPVVLDSFRKSLDSQEDRANNNLVSAVEVRRTDSTEKQEMSLKPSTGINTSKAAGHSKEIAKSEPQIVSDEFVSANEVEGLDESLLMNGDAVTVVDAKPILEREIDEPSQGVVVVEQRAQVQIECEDRYSYASTVEDAVTSRINGTVEPQFDDYDSSHSGDEVETQSSGEGRAATAIEGYKKPVSSFQVNGKKDISASLYLDEGLEDVRLLGVSQSMVKQRPQVHVTGKLAVPMPLFDGDNSVEYNDIEAFTKEDEQFSRLSLKRTNKPARGSMVRTEEGLETELQTRKTLLKQRFQSDEGDILDSSNVQEPFYTKNKGLLGRREPSIELQSDRTRRYIDSHSREEISSVKQTQSQDSENVKLESRWEEKQPNREMNSGRQKRHMDSLSKDEVASIKQTHSEEDKNLKIESQWEEAYIGRLDSDEYFDCLDLSSHANSQMMFHSVVRSLDHRHGSNGPTRQALDRRGESIQKLKLKQDQYYMESLQFHDDDDVVSFDLSDHSSSSESPRTCHDYMPADPHVTKIVPKGLRRNMEYRKANFLEPSSQVNTLSSLHVPSEVHGALRNNGIQAKRRDDIEDMANSGNLRWKSSHDSTAKYSEPFAAAKATKAHTLGRTLGTGALLSEVSAKPTLQGKSFYGESRRTSSRTTRPAQDQFLLS